MMLFKEVMLPGKTWNPVTGCTKYSLGCAHCYAERIALRLQKDGVRKYRSGFKVTLHPQELEKPLHWKKPHAIFVVSMGDLFHEDVPDQFIVKVFDVMNRAYWHHFRLLTKRIERMLDISKKVRWSPNIWAGVTVEHRAYLHRIDILKKIPAHIRYINFSPLLSDIPWIDLTGIDWVITGGESGPNARPARPEWIRHIRDMCKSQGVPFYFAQWGGLDRKKNGNVLDGRIYEELPVEKMIMI